MKYAYIHPSQVSAVALAAEYSSVKKEWLGKLGQGPDHQKKD